MITHHKIDGYESFSKLLEILDCKGQILMFFSGSPNPAGNSWSSVCNKSAVIIGELVKQNEHKTFHFVQVGIGTEEEWKNPECPFRTDTKLKLKDVPVLLLWRTKSRLTGAECENGNNVRTLIDDIP